ncbi:MAG: DUF3810 domain-containing protein [Eubacteriales bacterium]|nr:DUF3810 domain-containing protein [Eubacteriales bacterium]
MATKKKKRKKKQKGLVWLGKLAFLIPAAVAVLLYLLLPLMPKVTEALFSRGVFVALAAVSDFLWGWIPVSLTEYLLLALPVALILFIILAIRRVRKKGADGKRIVVRFVKGVAWTVSCGLLLYMLMHGANFYRLTLPELTGLTPVQNDTEELIRVTRLLAAAADEQRSLTEEDENGVMRLSASLSDTLSSVKDGYGELRGTLTFLPQGARRVKPVLLSYYWSYTGITGMYDPILGEANINVYMPDSNIPFTAAHETAHTMGFAREDECNFLGFLCCIRHPSPDFRYSGYLTAYIYCSNQLAKAAPEQWLEIRNGLSDGVKADLACRSLYWAGFSGKTMEVSQSVNNTFIAAQGVADGTASYDRVVGLILGYYGK